MVVAARWQQKHGDGGVILGGGAGVESMAAWRWRQKHAGSSGGAAVADSLVVDVGGSAAAA